jgi:hypothetical protein
MQRNLSIVLLCCAALALPRAARAQEEQGSAGSQAEARADEARFEKRILHLADGRRLRVRAREVEGGFELRQGGGTALVPSASVERATFERDVLAEAQRLQKDVDPTQPAERVALASWMFGEGLYEEGLELLDLVLGLDPDQPAALALLKRDPPPLALPELAPDEDGVSEFVRQVAGAKPASREVAAQRLATVGDQVDLCTVLARETQEDSVRRRAFAAFALRRLFPGREVKALLNRAVLDGSSNVRHEAALALRDAEEPAVMLPVLKALGSTSTAVRANAAEALGAMGYPAAVAPLVNHLATVDTLAQSGGGYHPPASNIFVGRQISYVQDYDVEVAQNASIADPTINTIMEGSVLDVRVLAVTQSKIASEKAAVRTALGKLTGADPGHTTAAWMRWWDEHGAEWTARASTPSPSTPMTPGR